MPALADRNTINAARGAYQVARLAVLDARFALEEATNAFAETKRKSAPGSADYVARSGAVDAATTAHATAVLAEAAARGTLNQRLANWFVDAAGGAILSADADVARLDQLPILLLPVRLETRFDGNVLKVRVFPDEIFVNTHETALTRAEQAAGRHYYEELNRRDVEPELWRELAGEFGAERAAYILRAMLPTGFEIIAGEQSCTQRIRGGQMASLTFPSVKLRAGAWTRPGEALLPDRWVVVTYRAGVRRVILGSAIPEPLPITADPGHTQAQQVPISRNPYRIEQNLLWTVDFAQAKAVGMGIEVPLSAAEAAVGTGGFDRIVVFGVKSSMGIEETVAHFTLLLDAHHFTRGLALVRQGTPTNNTADSPTPFPPEDEEFSRSFDIERPGVPSLTSSFQTCGSDGDGGILARVLGVFDGAFAQVDRNRETEVLRSSAMTAVMWPLTYGYFMKTMMDPVFTDVGIQRAKAYCVATVHPRGLTPAFRIGATPYGVLPITSLYRWQPLPQDESILGFVASLIVAPLRRLFPIWRDAARRVPRIVENSTRPDVDLMSVLSTYPSAREVRVRHGIGGVTTYNVFNLFGWDFQLVSDRMDQQTEALFRRLGHPEWRPRIGRVSFDDRAFRLLGPLVSANPSEDRPLATDFITGIADASVLDLKNDNVPTKPPEFNFFYSLLRHSTLVEYGRIANELAAQALRFPEFELFGFPLFPPASSWVDLVLSLSAQVRTNAEPHLQVLRLLAGTPTAELERLFSESLDLASHRIDPWISSLAIQRLLAIRAAPPSIGQCLGGYAWVEDVRPVARTFSSAPLPGIGTVELQPNTGGFIHTPSMTHAATAAILRNGYMSMKREDPTKYAVDLSSRRVRSARRVLAEVRNGQPLGAVLGYRFERALHEGHPGVPGLDAIRFAFRSLFPLVAGKDGIDTSAPAESIAARNVVDGLALLRASHEGTIDYAGDPRLPNVGSTAYNVVQSELQKLDQLHDAVADLVMAEGVHQLALGNLGGAPASLDNLVVGGPPPDPAVARSIRSGIGIAHRVALVFATNRTADLPPGWPAPTPRATAEPTLDAWLGRTIGDPTRTTCRVTFTEPPGSAVVTLADLALRPLDLVALARVVAEQGLGSVLDQRVLAAAIPPGVTRTGVSIDYSPVAGRDPAVDRTFPEVLEVLRAFGVATGGVRPLQESDLRAPAEVDEVDAAEDTAARADAAEIEGRAAQTSAALTQIATGPASGGPSLTAAIAVANDQAPTPAEIAALRAALLVAASFAPERAFPPRDAPGTALLKLARGVRVELVARLGKMPPAADPLGPPKDRVDRATSVLKVAFGEDFVALPAIHAPRRDEITRSLAARAALLGTDLAAPSRYLQQAARTRPALRRFGRFTTYARALGRPTAAINVVQLPHVPGERWLGGELTTPPDQGRAAVLLLSEEAAIDPAAAWRGIMIEQWTEIIPQKKETTAIAFQFDSPRAAAPQAVLVAVPASGLGPWQFEDLLASLNETAELAKIRAVDTELLPFGQVLPLTLLAQNDAPDVTFATFISQIASAGAEAFKGFSL